jgi:hypothetical protein
MKLNRLKMFATAIALLTLGFSSGAFAQYVWLDEKGVKQYSDMPPPASVPQKRILKAPGLSSHAATSTPAESAATAPPGEDAAKDKTPLTTAEKNADFNKRRTEQAEKEKKSAEEAQRVAENAKRCEQARSYQRALQSGTRIARTDNNGERSFLDDEQRASEAREAQRILDACK